jgi:hypothetical protein
MRNDFSHSIGFQPPSGARARKRCRTACAELALTLALALCTAVALTAVSIGMARADALGSIVRHDGGPWGVALLLGVMGALTAFVTRIVEARARR